MNATELGTEVVRRRRELGWNQDELADKADLSRTYISLIERGEAVNVTRRVLEKLSEVLDLPISRLIGESGPSDLLISPALKQFALEHHLSLDTVDRLIKIPRRGQEPRNAEEWRLLYDAVKQWL